MKNDLVVKPHFYVGGSGQVKKYTYPKSVNIKANVPLKDRQEHGVSLKEKIAEIKGQEQRVVTEYKSAGIENPSIQLVFHGEPGADFGYEKLADVRKKIELLNVASKDDSVSATVYVPQGKLSSFEKKLDDYLSEKKNKNGAPLDNRLLIDAIHSINLASIDDLWSDDPDLLPQNSNEELWWEVWLPVLGDRVETIEEFKAIALANDIVVSENILEFPERSVLLVKTSKANLSSNFVISKIAEIRKPKTTAEFFDQLEPLKQAEWTEDLLERTVVESNESPYICILDTGSNSDHPLLSKFIDPSDQFTIDIDWGATDDNGHGTGMAGLSVWGDLSDVLGTVDSIRIGHRVETVKVLRYSGDNEGKHLGNITSEGISIPEIENYDRKRVFTMALGAKDSRDRGKPSAWSSAVDGLACDALGENLNPRLIVVSAGNTGDNLSDLVDYPSYNELEDIHDPGQSWNAITIGAYTRKDRIMEVDAQLYSPLARHGGLSPYSTTSVLWNQSMPIKPEVVFEGGNVGYDEAGCASMPSLNLLTTHHQWIQRHFSTFRATSASTALASRFAAQIYSQYPSLRPETVRALMVHSADWTEEMRTQFKSPGDTEKQLAKKLVRRVGFGVPSLNKALWSANNSLSMIIEDHLQPFEKKKGKEPSTRDMHLHQLPWPEEMLRSLGDVEVKMTVTLSYFIEPNPSSRNVSSRYRYPSHQLRFEVRRPTEKLSQFMGRISRAVRDDEEGTTQAPSDPNWLLGEWRNKGSIHKDVWTGTASALADRGYIVVYPALGWWRTRKSLERYTKEARYSLIISIETPEQDIDLYTEVESLIQTENIVSVDSNY